MNKYEIVKFVDDEVKLDVNISPLEKTIWINIEQISVLFERDRSVISKHIKNIFLEGEVLENSVCAFFAHTANDGKEYNVPCLPLVFKFFIYFWKYSIDFNKVKSVFFYNQITCILKLFVV